MQTTIEQIAANYIRLLPLLYAKLNKPILQNADTQKPPADLTHLQYHILDELFHQETGTSVSQLAKIIGISKQQMTPLIAKLADKGYVVKVPDPRDKRSVRVMLTDKGKAIVNRRWEEGYKRFRDRISQLSEEDLLDLDYAISKLTFILGKLV